MERPRFLLPRTKIPLVEELNCCLYSRKSTSEEDRQIMSIDSQIREMTKLAEAEGLNIIDIKRESHSAKVSGQREVFNRMLEEIEEGVYNALICWDVSRISRASGDSGRVVDLMDRGLLLEIITHGQKFRNTPNDKFLLLLLTSQSKMENDVKGVNVKRGLRTRCEMGIRPGGVPLGYKLIRNSENFKEPSKIVVDEERAPFIKKMFKYVNEGLSGRQVNEYLNDEGFRSKSGKTIGLSMTFRILRESFYCGEFEYPKKSGNWYRGSYPVIISKEEFDEAQKKIKVVDKGVWGRKSFYFSKLLKCGHCGSGISGEEQVNRWGKMYIYYKCNKHGGRKTCRSKYIREENLVKALSKIVDKLRSSRFRLNLRIEREVEKLNAMQKITNKDNPKTISTREYIEFILKEGNIPEKADLLKCIEGQLVLKDGEIYLE